MKIEIKKSEVAVLKQALKNHAWLIYSDKCLWGDKVYENPLSKKYKISLLKNLALIEHRLIGQLYKTGYHTKKTGNSNCWWLWSTTDKNWKRKYNKEIKEDKLWTHIK